MSETQLDAFCTGGSSPPSSACDTVSTATPSISGTKRGPVPKRRFQKGTFVKRGDNWVGMWRVDTLQPDGTMKREQRSQTFIGLSERVASAALQPILDAVNAANRATPPVPKTSDTVAKAVVEWREHAAVSLKPSTRRSAESHLRRHILPLLGECPLTGFDCQENANLLHIPFALGSVLQHQRPRYNGRGPTGHHSISSVVY
jgi:Phage integrase, N-terminal SAM-like domain